MRSIGQIIGGGDLDEKMRLASKSLEAERVKNADKYGWPQDCECHECGDTGYRFGDAEDTCWCDAGRGVESAREVGRKWKEDIPRRFWGFNLDGHTNYDLVADCREWIETGYRQRKNLIIEGSYGSGKTGASVGILSELYFDYDVKFIFGTFAEFLDQIRAGFDRDNEQDALSTFRLQQAPILVIDDLGAEKPTDWVSERLYQIVNERYQHQRPTIFTTNLTKDEVTERVGERIAARVYSGSTHIIAEGDFRKE